MRFPVILTIIVAALSGCNGLTKADPFAPVANDSVMNAAQSRRLFVTDSGTEQIYLYDVPSLRLFRILQGIQEPGGACANDKGDVWIANDQPDEIVEVNYAGNTTGHMTTPRGYDPVSCAWDPKTGNLAVTNNFFDVTEFTEKPGELLVYPHAKGTPSAYVAKLYYYSYAGYDDSGNLYFDGALGKLFRLYELPYGQKTPEKLVISGATIYKAGMVQWDASSGLLDVGDQNCHKHATSCIYQFKISGTTATETNEIDLKTSTGSEVCDVAEAVVSAGEIYGSDYETCGYSKSATYGWPYPAGSDPSHVAHAKLSHPVGAAMAVQAQAR